MEPVGRFVRDEHGERVGAPPANATLEAKASGASDTFRVILSTNVRVCVRPYSHGVRLLELADLLDLIHEISSVDVLHNKIQPVLEDKAEEESG